jgi:hypothetical protein
MVYVAAIEFQNDRRIMHKVCCLVLFAMLSLDSLTGFLKNGQSDFQ